jgi:hypothetical protein
MSKAAVLLVYLRDSLNDWAAEHHAEHHIERLGKLAGSYQARIATLVRAT